MFNKPQCVNDSLSPVQIDPEGQVPVGEGTEYPRGNGNLLALPGSSSPWIGRKNLRNFTTFRVGESLKLQTQ